MQELEQPERYSIAALFTLALHSAAAQSDKAGEGWGEPEEGYVYSDPDPSSDEPDPFWGRDLVLRGGLLDAIYFQLGLPPFKWAGLKALPSVAPTTDSAAFRGAVRSLIAVLDEDLAAALPAPSVKKQDASPRAGRVNVPDELWDGLLESSDEEDEELVKDKQWERHLEEHQERREKERQLHGLGSSSEDPFAVDSPLAREGKKTLQELQELSSPKASLKKQRSEEYSILVKQLEELSAAENEKLEAEKLKEQNGSVNREQGGNSTAAALETPTKTSHAEPAAAAVVTPAPVPRKKSSAPVDVSPIAVAALWELLQCCIGAHSAASEAAKAAADAETEDHIKNHPTSPKFLRRQGPPPCVRWYDARARVALGLVSLWLQVPPRKVATLEVLLGSDKAPTTVRQRGDTSSAAADRYRYLKVGLAAVGGGALFAVTGGLAAPAIAAGVGSILGVVPGAGAAAGAVAGFMSTQVGVAAVTTTMATAGAATTGSKMAYRTAEVKDFGFVELKESMAPAALSNSKSPAPAIAMQRRTSSSALDTPSESKPSTVAAERSNSTPDPGHLNLSMANLGAGGRTPSSVSMRSSSAASLADSSSNGGAGTTFGGQDAQGDPSGSNSTWKSWFSTKKTAKEEEESTTKEPELLPVPVRPAHPAEGIKLSTVIGVSGWITNPDDFTTPWTCLSAPAADRFALVWCTSELQALNSALGALLAKGAAGQAAKLGMQHLLIGGAGLVSALGPTVILGAAAGLLIENAWTVALDRSDKAGKLLAHVLMSGGGGGRPVTLVAHSMGARLVFSALLELCRCGARGLIQDVVLLGCPVSPAVERWKMARRVVAGRLVNGYSRQDWMLSVMFWQGIAKPAAGLAPVEVDGIENVSLSSVVNGHFDYIGRLHEILELLQVLV